MIKIRNIHKSFFDKKVLQGVDLDINNGETFVIIGPSGCGKSVMLKHIVGLLVPDQGAVEIEGKNISQLSTRELFNIRKRFGFLFQGAALFDSFTVGENVGLPLVENRDDLTIEEIYQKAEEKLILVGLPNIQHLKPSELSGGMRKRVGLARALINDPDFILYDEPTTGLDPIMSDSIDELIKELATKLNVTSIVVTHDMYSVHNVADRVALMHNGKIHFIGTPKELTTSDDPIIVNFIKRTDK